MTTSAPQGACSANLEPPASRQSSQVNIMSSSTSTADPQAGSDTTTGSGTPAASIQPLSDILAGINEPSEPETSQPKPPFPPRGVTKANETHKLNELAHLVSQMTKHWPTSACPQSVWAFFCRRYDAYIGYLVESWIDATMEEEHAYRRWHVSWVCHKFRHEGATRSDAYERADAESRQRVKQAHEYFVWQVLEDLGTTVEKRAALECARVRYGFNSRLTPIWERDLHVDYSSGYLNFWDCRQPGLSDQQDKPEFWKSQAVQNAGQWDKSEDDSAALSSWMLKKAGSGKEARSGLRLPRNTQVRETDSVESEMDDFGAFRIWRPYPEVGYLPQIMITCED